jgi:hypothetical protein
MKRLLDTFHRATHRDRILQIVAVAGAIGFVAGYFFGLSAKLLGAG